MAGVFLIEMHFSHSIDFLKRQRLMRRPQCGIGLEDSVRYLLTEINYSMQVLSFWTANSVRHGSFEHHLLKSVPRGTIVKDSGSKLTSAQLSEGLYSGT